MSPLRSVFAVLISLLLVAPVGARAGSDAKAYGNVTVDEVTSIYDGDTFRVTIKDWPLVAGYRIGVRVKGVDTPEINSKCQQEKALARKAKQFTVDFLRSGKIVELRNLQRDKYFRLLAEVYVDNHSLTEALLKNGLGYAYEGGTKKKWCTSATK